MLLLTDFVVFQAQQLLNYPAVLNFYLNLIELLLAISVLNGPLDILTKDNLTKSTICRNIFGKGQFDEYKFAEKTIWRDKFDEK